MMNKYLTLAVLSALLGCAATVQALPEDIEALNHGTHFEHYTSWLQEHKPGYMNDVDQVADRFKVFAKNLDKIREINAENRSYYLGLTGLTDLTQEEYRKFYLNPELKNVKQTSTSKFTHANVEAVDKIDWRDKGAVTPVKNQGMCGSCWAFSSTGSMEGINFIQNGKLVSLSEEQLVNCDKVDHGCGGGLMDQAFQYVIKNGGIDTEEDFPYHAFALWRTCPADKESEHAVVINDFVDVPVQNKDALLQALSAQPVSIAIEADHFVFQNYRGGVIDSAGCGTQLDHGVLAVGFDTTADTPYWIVKNSWGASWGESGYVRMAINVTDPKGQCGILSCPVYPVINK
ncbi:cysteine proteinase [Chloropicon primus]|uniref:Cysteine proteinase n=1 Tax=Chloropicon primus TaxID=1764295 RepID=A0A5B8MSW3_9CHLO|nr:cysteine proteinase [Chloropicon primus]UPR02589.1 cysteine proteinase [Chloropicon primus]|eukprot:QDZ23377.1 cysteine proteinase [Chloropicon primus]